MRIAVNAASFINQTFENDKNSYSGFFLRLAISQPKHTFIFIFDKPQQKGTPFPENVVPVMVGPEATTIIKLRIWYHIKIPAALKKHKADIFISEKLVSLKTKIPQLLIAPDLSFLHQPSFINKKHLDFYKKNTPRFINKADTIIVYSQFLKNEIIKRYKTDEKRIEVIYKETNDHFNPLSYEEKEVIKEKYADGNEYFIYKGTISKQQNLMNLLKAFSVFKKRQKSKMHLIIIGNSGIGYKEFMESLRLFRFHNEVKVLENIPINEMSKMIASAYSMIFVPLYETVFTQPLEAMKCEIPVIVSSTGALPEFCGDAALYCDPENYKDIAEKMMLIFKDEKGRKELIEKGKIQIKKFPSGGSLETTFQIIESLARKTLSK